MTWRACVAWPCHVATPNSLNAEAGPGISFPMSIHLNLIVACLVIMYQCTRIHSLHPPPWPGHSFPLQLILTVRLFAHSVPVYPYTLASSSYSLAYIFEHLRDIELGQNCMMM